MTVLGPVRASKRVTANGLAQRMEVLLVQVPKRGRGRRSRQVKGQNANVKVQNGGRGRWARVCSWQVAGCSGRARSSRLGRTRVAQAGGNPLTREVWEFSPDFLEGPARRQVAKNQAHGNPCSLDSWFPAQHVGSTDDFVTPAGFGVHLTSVYARWVPSQARARLPESDIEPQSARRALDAQVKGQTSKVKVSRTTVIPSAARNLAPPVSLGAGSAPLTDEIPRRPLLGMTSSRKRRCCTPVVQRLMVRAGLLASPILRSLYYKRAGSSFSRRCFSPPPLS